MQSPAVAVIVTLWMGRIAGRVTVIRMVVVVVPIPGAFRSLRDQVLVVVFRTHATQRDRKRPLQHPAINTP
ncbi:hypothetical protein [Carbonactinospora thermoautotrophica]|nr:hypothetical protein [Carbonactinospora thermoautotrophica]